MLNYLKKITLLGILACSSTIVFAQPTASKVEKTKPRVLISSDIGGTDDDDLQSMIHLMMYSDKFKLEGLVSSPFGDGRVKNFLDMIDLYEQDYPKLVAHNSQLMKPNALRKLCKQGALPGAPYKGYDVPTEGSKWIVSCAKKKSDQPLWVLVWGGIDDLAQALHDAPEIQKNIKVYFIGGPNKKWCINAYAYIAQNFPNLWIIEANATYRGWILDSESPKEINYENFYPNYIKGYGAMGKAFKNYYKGNIKMGDTPSLAYVLNGDPNNPLIDHWGGSFTPIKRSARAIFQGNSTIKDTIAAYGTIEWHFKGPKKDISKETPCFTIEISNQKWPGYYLGDGIYSARYSSKKPETISYVTTSEIPELNNQKGQLVSSIPWPGKPNPTDYILGDHWYSDRQEPELFLEGQQGARTVSKFRSEFLLDWAKKWEWLK